MYSLINDNYYFYCKCNKLQATSRAIIMAWLWSETNQLAIYSYIESYIQMASELQST